MCSFRNTKIPGTIETPLLCRFGLGNHAIRRPTLVDMLASLAGLLRLGNETDNGLPLYSFLQGVESEAEQFFANQPKFFFINCAVVMLSGQEKIRLTVAFPVIFKHDHYYIIIGEEYTPVYRVLNPKELFFTTKGKQDLMFLLKKNHKKDDELINFYENQEGNRETYCVPDGAAFHSIPTNIWDGCDNAIIASQAMTTVVNDQGVPPNCKSSLQIVNLNDTVNIVNIPNDGAYRG